MRRFILAALVTLTTLCGCVQLPPPGVKPFVHEYSYLFGNCEVLKVSPGGGPPVSKCLGVCLSDQKSIAFDVPCAWSGHPLKFE